MNETTKRVGNFVWVGIVLTLIDYAVCELLVLVVFRDAAATSIATVLSGIVSTVAAFFMHSRITWRDRKMNTAAVVKFFLWNVAVMMVLRPFLVWVFGLMGWLYEFCYGLVAWMGISHDFVASTLAYGLVTVITLTLNYLFYDRFVFGEKKAGDKVNVKRVRQARKEK